MTQNYSALAPIYDRIMSHVEYDQWVLYIKRIFGNYGETNAPRILEIGGGTGLLGSKLCFEGYRYIGSDRSFSMCRQSQKRGVPFVVADACNLPFKDLASFDMALFLYDGINYLQTIDAYRTVFEEIHKRLADRGLFLFDITTLANSLGNFSDFLDAGEFDGHFYFRRSYFHAIDSMQYNDFTIFREIRSDRSSEQNAPVFEKSFEHHAQKVFHAKEIKDAVPDQLFEVMGIWDNFSFKRYSSGSDRIHFLLKKKTA